MKDKLKENMLYTISYQCLVIVYPLLTIPLISKVLGTELLGVYSYTYSIAYYFSLVAALGIHNYGRRLISINRDNKYLLNKYFWEIYTVQFVMSFIVLAIYLSYVYLRDNDLRNFSLLQGIVILTGIVDITWFMAGIEEFKTMVIRNTIIKLLSLILLFYCIQSNDDLWLYILIVAGTNCIGQLYVWPLASKYLEFPKSIRFLQIKQHIKPIIKLFLPVIALNSYVFIDKIMLGMTRTMGEVGYYENCDRLIRMPIGLSSAASSALIPRASYYIAKGERKKNNKIVFSTLKFNFIFMIPIVIGLGGIAPELVPWYFGDEFLPCIRYIQLLAPIILFMVVNYILRVQYFVAEERDTEYIISIIGAALINLIINICLIKSLGIYGVIIGSIVSEMCASIYLVYRSGKDLHFYKLVKDIVFSLIISLMMLLIIRKIGESYGVGILTNIKQMIVGATFYFGIYFVCHIMLKRKNKNNEEN